MPVDGVEAGAQDNICRVSYIYEAVPGYTCLRHILVKLPRLESLI